MNKKRVISLMDHHPKVRVRKKNWNIYRNRYLDHILVDIDSDGSVKVIHYKKNPRGKSKFKLSSIKPKVNLILPPKDSTLAEHVKKHYEKPVINFSIKVRR